MLSRFVEEHCDFCVIDPFKNIYPLLDRIQIQEILIRLEGLSAEGRPKLRAPCFLKVFLTELTFMQNNGYIIMS